MTVNAGDIVRATSQHLFDNGNVVQNVYHYLAADGVGALEAEVRTAIKNRIDTALSELSDSLWNGMVRDKYLFQLSQDGGTTFTDMGEELMGGTAPAGLNEALPPQTSFRVSFAADSSGYKGSKQLGVFTELFQNAGVLTAAAITDIANYTLFAVASTSVTGGLMVPGWLGSNPTAFHRYNGTVFVDTQTSTVSKRKQGRGI